MGRGQGGENKLEDGEIPLLDADRLSDHVGDFAKEGGSESSFGSPEDDRAIRSLISRLQSLPTSRSKSPEEIEDQAIELYNLSCQKVLSPRCTPEQLANIAQLFGEKPEALQARLRQDQGTEELAGPEGGAMGLLRALRD